MRVLENEVMMSEEEVIAYDLLVEKYLKILHNGFVETVINQSPAEGKFLDVGTGTGWIAIGVAKNTSGIEVTGVDLSDAMISVAGRNSLKTGVDQKVRLVMGDAKGLAFEDGTFDAVFCHNMLHHLPEPEKLLNEMVRVAKPDGAVIVRDLVRHSRFVAEMHVNIFGLTYNQLMKKEYRDSILAALSKEEWRALFEKINLPGGRLTSQFVTHMSIERPAVAKRRDYVTVPTPLHLQLAKSFYVSRP
jgi:ubiquinone/menaquinone biosynthesis C-methylase UbiE